MLKGVRSTKAGSLVISLALLALVAVVDTVSGYEIGMFVFYYLPIGLATWSVGPALGYAMAVLCSGVWLGTDLIAGHIYTAPWYVVWNSVVRLIAFVTLAWLLDRVRGLLARERETSEQLRAALQANRDLLELIPMCAWCKKIRSDGGYWERLETWFSQNAHATFTHGICPECRDEVMKEGE